MSMLRWMYPDRKNKNRKDIPTRGEDTYTGK